MTTREATQLLPRADEDGLEFERRVRDWASLFAFGAVQWPWLLRSLRGGSKDEKRALLARLDLPADALPNLGSWKADTRLLHRIVNHIFAARPRLVVEFGTGASTLIAARALQINGSGRLISFDQHADFVAATREWLAEHGLTADIRAAPLTEPAAGWRGLWYDHGPLPGPIDLMIVDGPCWTIHPLVRGSADSLFDRIAIGGIVMLDDGARPGERVVMARWKKRWPNFRFRLLGDGTKGTVVGVREG